MEYKKVYNRIRLQDFVKFAKVYKIVVGRGLPNSFPKFVCREYFGCKITFYPNKDIFFNGALSPEVMSLLKMIFVGLGVGSDEVGSGEAVGPLIVSAFQFKSVDDKITAFTEGLKDSKKLSEKEIRRLGKLLLDLGKVESKTVFGKEYRQLKDDGINANGIKVLCHWDVQFRRVWHGSSFRVIDKFVSEKGFDKHLSKLGISGVLPFDIINIEKAESMFLEVAAAAVISKYLWYCWLDEFRKENILEGSMLDNFRQREFIDWILSHKSLEDQEELLKPFNLENY